MASRRVTMPTDIHDLILPLSSMTSEGKYLPRFRTSSEHASNDLPNPAPRMSWIHPTLVVRARLSRLAAHVFATTYLFRCLAQAKLLVPALRLRSSR